ncbi:hypothetical protein Hanom_Chr14g01287011 [Helianthus anomalus]
MQKIPHSKSVLIEVWVVANNGSDILLIQYLMVFTVCFVSRCLNGSDICL